MLLEARLVELRIVEGVKVRRQSTEHPDKPELPGDAIASETEPHFLREFESVFGLSFDFVERIAGCETICCQIDAAIGGIGKVAGILRRLEGAPQEARDVPRGCVQWATWTAKTK